VSDDADNAGEFNPLHHPAIFSTPRMLSAESAWVSHVPLAYFMIELARPRVLVELGTHRGDSYCAFCQAVAQLQLPTRCYAIDTWRGDPQAGFYGAEVLKSLKAHHDPIYSGFSTLMQTDFDSAASQFADASIDLLHLDGHHTYDSVRHDFQTWLPKMSQRGVMLFHDTNVRNRATFGVFRLWEEVSAKYPSFELPYGFGLGIAAVGAEPPPEVLRFLHSAQSNADAVRKFFYEMGLRVIEMQVLLRTSEQLIGQWNVLSQWRQATRQPALAQINISEIFQNPEPLARAITQHLTHLAQNDLKLRQHLAPSAQPPAS